jgi:ribosomal protein S17
VPANLASLAAKVSSDGPFAVSIAQTAQISKNANWVIENVTEGGIVGSAKK